jgi:predicted RNA-binding protein (virulence factor B family)
MTAPKPGDRVWGVVEGCIDWGDDNAVVLLRMRNVEVLSKPYVNSDTTRVEDGDVARIVPAGAVVMYDEGDSCWRYIPSGNTASEPRDGERLTLLVRSGVVVQ